MLYIDRYRFYYKIEIAQNLATTQKMQESNHMASLRGALSSDSDHCIFISGWVCWA